LWRQFETVAPKPGIVLAGKAPDPIDGMEKMWLGGYTTAMRPDIEEHYSSCPKIQQR
jgi:hypothetical protein